jgi:septal ring factor EnvC (AmiA/AmiB activator)
MSKYIKVTEKDKQAVVVLAANKSFFASQGFKIEEPAQKEIESFFPEEKPDFPGKTTQPAVKLETVNSELETVKKELEAEKAAHEETKQTLATANSELETVKATLNEAQKKITKLSK